MDLQLKTPEFTALSSLVVRDEKTPGSQTEATNGQVRKLLYRMTYVSPIQVGHVRAPGDKFEVRTLQVWESAGQVFKTDGAITPVKTITEGNRYMTRCRDIFLHAGRR